MTCCLSPLSIACLAPPLSPRLPNSASTSHPTNHTETTTWNQPAVKPLQGSWAMRSLNCRLYINYIIKKRTQRPPYNGRCARVATQDVGHMRTANKILSFSRVAYLRTTSSQGLEPVRHVPLGIGRHLRSQGCVYGLAGPGQAGMHNPDRQVRPARGGPSLPLSLSLVRRARNLLSLSHLSLLDARYSDDP